MPSKATSARPDGVAKPPPTLRVRVTLEIEFKVEDLSIAADVAAVVKEAVEKLQEVGEVTRHDQQFLI